MQIIRTFIRLVMPVFVLVAVNCHELKALDFSQGLIDEVTKVLKKAQKSETKPQVEEASEDEVNSCLVSTCGEAKDSLSGQLISLVLSDLDDSSDIKHSPELDQFWHQGLLQKIRENLDKQKILDKKFAEALQSLRAKIGTTNAKKLAVSEEVRATQALRNLIAETPFEKLFILSDGREEPHLDLDRRKFDHALSEMSQAKRDVLYLFLSRYASDFKIIFYSESSNKLSGVAQSLFPSLSLKEALRELGRQILESMAIKRGSFLDFFFSSKDKILATRLMNGDDLNPAEAERLYGVYNTATYLAAALSETLRPRLLKLQPPTPTKRMKTLLDKAHASIKEYLRQSTEDQVTLIRKHCDSKVSAIFRESPTSQQLVKFQETLAIVKDTSKSIAKRFVSPEFHRIFDDLIDHRAEFYLPQERSERLASLESTIRYSDPSEFAAVFELSEEVQTQFILDIAFFSQDGMGRKLPSEAEDCDKLKVEGISDQALTAFGKIWVSPFTVSHPEVGAGIIAHEIGHLWSAELRKKEIPESAKSQFLNTLNCVASRNPFATVEKALGAMDDTYWSEEDLADHFSSLVVRELVRTNRISNHVNVGCALVSSYENHYNEELAPADGDPHSSGLLRLLFMGSDTNTLSPLCGGAFQKAFKGRQVQCH